LKIRENLAFLVYEIGGSFDFEVGFSTRRSQPHVIWVEASW
jgi:hypothetical protein